MEDSTIEFQVERKCDLTKIGDKLDNKVEKNRETDDSHKNTFLNLNLNDRATASR